MYHKCRFFEVCQLTKTNNMPLKSPKNEVSGCCVSSMYLVSFTYLINLNFRKHLFLNCVGSQIGKAIYLIKALQMPNYLTLQLGNNKIQQCYLYIHMYRQIALK